MDPETITHTKIAQSFIRLREDLFDNGTYADFINAVNSYEGDVPFVKLIEVFDTETKRGIVKSLKYYNIAGAENLKKGLISSGISGVAPILMQMAHTIDSLHLLGYAHEDIDFLNFLTKNNKIYLADFETVKRLGDIVNVTHVMNPKYGAPDLIIEDSTRIVDGLADIYSFFLVCAEILYNIDKAEFYLLKYTKFGNHPLNSIAKRAMDDNPSERYKTALEVVEAIVAIYTIGEEI